MIQCSSPVTAPCCAFPSGHASNPETQDNSQQMQGIFKRERKYNQLSKIIVLRFWRQIEIMPGSATGCIGNFLSVSIFFISVRGDMFILSTPFAL